MKINEALLHSGAMYFKHRNGTPLTRPMLYHSFSQHPGVKEMEFDADSQFIWQIDTDGTRIEPPLYSVISLTIEDAADIQRQLDYIDSDIMCFLAEKAGLSEEWQSANGYETGRVIEEIEKRLNIKTFESRPFG